MEAIETVGCAFCECTEQQRPLVILRFEGKAAWCCPTCMPALIHGRSEDQIEMRVRDAVTKA